MSWESLDIFRAAIAIFPKMFKAYYWAVKALLVLKDRKGAIEIMECARQQQPPHMECLRLQACVLYTRHDDLNASKLLEEALCSEPNDATIHFDLGFCYQAWVLLSSLGSVIKLGFCYQAWVLLSSLGSVIKLGFCYQAWVLLSSLGSVIKLGFCYQAWVLLSSLGSVIKLGFCYQAWVLLSSLGSVIKLGFCYQAWVLYQGLEEYSKATNCYTTALRLNYPRVYIALANRADC